MSSADEGRARQARDKVVKLGKRLSDEQRKISAAVDAATKLREQAARSSSSSSAKSKLSQADRKDRDLVQAQKRVARIQDSVSTGVGQFVGER